MHILNTPKKEQIKLNQIAEKFILDTIQNDHPDWVDQNGECPKCDEYYESLSDIVTIEGLSP